MVRIILEDIKINNKNKLELYKKKDLSTLNNFSEFNKDKIEDYKVDSSKEKEIEKYNIEKNNINKRLERTPQIKKRSGLINNKIIILFFIVIISLVVYFIGNNFEKAEIRIISKKEIINYNNKIFTANKDNTNKSINFEIMIVSDSKIKNITLTEPEEVSLKSKGKITLYNEFITTPQKLSKGTFLSDENGKSYQLSSDVVIPGYKNENKKLIAGSVVVDVNSFLPGDLYNGSPNNFFINSFKGTAKYNKIYGKLQSPFVGGVVGVIYKLDDINKKNIENSVKSSFYKDLISKSQSLVPPGYILYIGATNFTYKIDDSIFYEKPEAQIKIDGVLTVVLLKEKTLTDNIIKTSLPNISKDELNEVSILNTDKLSFNFIDTNQILTKDTDTISFYLNGNVNVSWNPDIEILKSKLIGVYKDEVLPILKQDKGIISASINIFPFWKKNIPNNLSKINIVVD